MFANAAMKIPTHGQMLWIHTVQKGLPPGEDKIKTPGIKKKHILMDWGYFSEAQVDVMFKNGICHKSLIISLHFQWRMYLCTSSNMAKSFQGILKSSCKKRGESHSFVVKTSGTKLPRHLALPFSASLQGHHLLP